LVFFQADLQLGRDFFFAGRAPQALLHRFDGRLDLFRAAALVLGSPIHLPQAVQNGSAYLVFRIRLELHALRRIEMVHGGDQADHTGRD
jgi:hypothetical protein